MKRCINHEISQDGCRKRRRDTSLIKIKLHLLYLVMETLEQSQFILNTERRYIGKKHENVLIKG